MSNTAFIVAVVPEGYAAAEVHEGRFGYSVRDDMGTFEKLEEARARVNTLNEKLKLDKTEVHRIAKSALKGALP